MNKESAFGSRVVKIGMLFLLSFLAASSFSQTGTQNHDVVSARLKDAVPSRVSSRVSIPLADGNWVFLGSGAQVGRIQKLRADTGAIETFSSKLAEPRADASMTLQPDGRILIYGGVSSTGRVLDTAELFNPTADEAHTLGSIGLLPRAGHSATLLSDGTIVFAGGFGADRLPSAQIEIFDPLVRHIEIVTVKQEDVWKDGLVSLLPGGDILFWQGYTSSAASKVDGAVYNAATHRMASVDADKAAELTKLFGNSEAPFVAASSPTAHQKQIPAQARLWLRFSKPMDVRSLTAKTVTLLGPSGIVQASAVAAERGMELFVTPAQDLIPDADYTLFIKGGSDKGGLTLPFYALSFKTARIETADHSETRGGDVLASTVSRALTAAGLDNGFSGTGQLGWLPVAIAPAGVRDIRSVVGSVLDSYGLSEGNDSNAHIPVDDTELWQPAASDRRGNWISRRAHLASSHPPQNAQLNRTLHGDEDVLSVMSEISPSSVAAGLLSKLKKTVDAKTQLGSTSVSGQALRLNGRPLANVTISIGDIQTITDLNGEFRLSGISGGHRQLVIEGRTASSKFARYGRFEYGFDVAKGKENALPFIVWMPRLDEKNAIEISSPTRTNTILTNPAIPGLELRIPAGTVIRDAHGKIVTHLSMTAIPTDQPPFPLPNFSVPTYFTVQPGGSRLESADGGPSKGAQLVYPNYSHSLPGTRMKFWDYDSSKKGWYIYGEGSVTADGTQVVPDPGVAIFELTGAMISVPANAPSTAPVSGNGKRRCGDPVDCATGLFLNEETDLAIPDVISVQVSRSYRQMDSAVRAFGIGTNLSYDSFLIGDTNPWTYQDLVLPDGGRIHFSRVSPGTSYTDAAYQNTDSPGRFYGATIAYVGQSDNYWTLKLSDGTSFLFGESYQSTSSRIAALRGLVDRNGNKLTLTRDSNSNLTQVTSPTGRHVNFTYDSSNRITQAKDDLNRTYLYGYDTQGRLISVTDPLLNVERFTYDSNHNMLTVQDKRGNTMVTNTFDSSNRVIKQVYADNSTMLFAYTLDGAGTRVVQTDITDQRGTISRTTYDVHGYPSSDTDAVGLPIQRTTTYSRDPQTNQLLSVTDQLNRTTSFSYDALGNLTKLSQPGNVNTSLAYGSPYSQLVQITNSSGGVTKFTYDGIGNPTQTTDPLNHSKVLTFDERGRPTNSTDALGQVTSISYFGADLTSTTDSLGRNVARSTDAVGRTVATYDPQGNTTVTTYDALDRVSSVTDPNGSVLAFTYDPNGNLLTRKDANLHTTTFTYDPLNRVSSKIDPLGFTETYLYEPGGNLFRKTDRGGQVTGIIYDALGRATQTGFGGTVSNPTAYTSSIAYTWDAANRLTQVVDSEGGTITRTYNVLDQLTQETAPQGTINYSYGTDGLKAGRTATGQPAISYTYDLAGRLTRIQQASDAISGNVAQNVDFSYDNADKPLQTKLPNGITANFSYNSASQVTGIIYRKSDNTQIGDLTYGYDQSGRRTSIGGSLAGVNLPPATTADAVYNDNNVLSQWNGVNQTSDTNGNLLGDGASSYTWNSRGQLVTVTGPAPATYQYDAFGRRIQRVANGVTSSFFYDGSALIQRTTAGSPAVILGGDLDQVYGLYKNSTVNVPLRDAVGSAVADTDGAQSLISNLSYTPYGEASRSGTVTENTQLFAGRESEGNGLYFNRARYYSSTTGRFISQDPVGWASGQANDFSYVGGNPVSLIDPFGLAGCPPNSIGAGGASASVARDAVGQIVGSIHDMNASMRDAISMLASMMVTGPMGMEEGALARAFRSIRLGREGEASVRASYEIGKKPTIPIPMSGNLRLPDGLTSTTISEVKNVQYQAFTQQLRDYLAYAQEQGLRFDLYLRKGADVSSELQVAFDTKLINRIDIPAK